MEVARSTSAHEIPVDHGPEQAAMQAYLREGERRAHALGNRGPIRFDADGSLHRDIGVSEPGGLLHAHITAQKTSKHTETR